jgi:uncharacterized membrane protein YhaH (DUF805 family)
MNFMDAVKSVYRNYATFSGRACRSELWWFFLFQIIVAIIIGFIEVPLGLGSSSYAVGDGAVSAGFSGGILSGIWALANLVPNLAVGVRRLHDTDRSGWWLLIGLVPLVGAIVLIVFYCTRGTTGPNRFGEDPLS